MGVDLGFGTLIGVCKNAFQEWRVGMSFKLSLPASSLLVSPMKELLHCLVSQFSLLTPRGPF